MEPVSGVVCNGKESARTKGKKRVLRSAIMSGFETKALRRKHKAKQEGVQMKSLNVSSITRLARSDMTTAEGHSIDVQFGTSRQRF